VPKNHKYTVLRLEFETPVRFGTGRSASGLDSMSMTAASDQFFAAVCMEWIQLYDEDSLTEMIGNVQEGNIAFSSLFPWNQTIRLKPDLKTEIGPIAYYLPRPLVRGKKSVESDTQVKKKLRKVLWIEAEAMQDYLEFVKTGSGDPTSFQKSFGSEVVWDRVNTRSGADNELYRVAAWQFDRVIPWSKENKKKIIIDKKLLEQRVSGLYWIISCQDESMLKKLIEAANSLGYSGVGGKISSGLGKYIVWEDSLEDSVSGKAMLSYLDDKAAPIQMALGCVVPYTDEDFSIMQDVETSYLLVSRTGFTSSADFCDWLTFSSVIESICSASFVFGRSI